MSSRSELNLFIENACYVGSQYLTRVDAIYYAYRVWAAGKAPMARNAFTQKMRQQLPETVAKYLVARVEGKSVRCFKGIALRARHLGQKPDGLPEHPAKMTRRRTTAETPPPAQVYRFMADCLVTAAEGEAKTAEVYRAYIDWTMDVDEHAHTHHVLTRRINEVFKGCESVRYGTHMFSDGTIAKGYRGLWVRT